MSIKALLLALTIATAGCGTVESGNCSQIPDGVYKESATADTATFKDGIPVSFDGWVCQPDVDACNTAQCYAPTGQQETITARLVSPGVVELTIGTVTLTLVAQ